MNVQKTGTNPVPTTSEKENIVELGMIHPDAFPVRFKIVDGPNRDRLFDSMKYAYDPDRVYARFFVETCSAGETATRKGKQELNLRIVKIEHECGNGHSFNIAGYITLKHRETDEQGNSTRKKVEYCFIGYYNETARTGTIEIS